MEAEVQWDHSTSEGDSASFCHAQIECNCHALIDSLLSEYATAMDNFPEFILKADTALT